MKYTTYLFDLDGTLCGRDDLVRNLVEQQYQDFHAEVAHIAPAKSTGRALNGYRGELLLCPRLHRCSGLGEPY